MLRVDNSSDVGRIKKKGKRNGDNYDESEYIRKKVFKWQENYEEKEPGTSEGQLSLKKEKKSVKNQL